MDEVNKLELPFQFIFEWLKSVLYSRFFNIIL